MGGERMVRWWLNSRAENRSGKIDKQKKVTSSAYSSTTHDAIKKLNGSDTKK